MFGWRKKVVVPSAEGQLPNFPTGIKSLLSLPPDQYFSSLDAVRSSNFSVYQNLMDGLGEILQLTNNLLEIISSDGPELIPRIMACAYRTLHSEKMSLFKVDLLTNEVVFTYSQDDICGIRVPVNGSIAGNSVLERSTINVSDAYNNSKFYKSVDEATHFRTVSVLCQPIICNDNVVSVIQAVNKHLVDNAPSPCIPFTELDEVLIQIIGDYLSIALKSDIAYSCSAPILDTPTGGTSVYIKNLVADFAHVLDLEETIRMTVVKVAKLVMAERVSVFLLDEATGELFLALSPDAKGLRVPTSTGLVGRCFRECRAIISSNTQLDDEFNNSIDATTGFFTKNTLCCPIFGENLASGCIGVIQAINKISSKGQTFDENDKLELLDLSHHVSNAIQNSRLFSQSVKESNLYKSILKISLALLSNDSHEAVLFDIADELKIISDAEYVKVCKCDPAAKLVTALSSMPSANSPAARRDSYPPWDAVPMDLQHYLLDACATGWCLGVNDAKSNQKVATKSVFRTSQSNSFNAAMQVIRSNEDVFEMIQEIEFPVENSLAPDRFILVPVTALSVLDSKLVPTRQTVIVIHLGSRKLSSSQLGSLDSLVKSLSLVLRTKARNDDASSPRNGSKSTPLPLSIKNGGILSVESITSAMSLISQYVFIMDKKLSFVWSNKSLNDLFGDDYAKAPVGSHIRTWLPDEFGSLLKDIELAQELLQPVNVTQAKFFTLSYPNGIVLSYTCHPIIVGEDEVLPEEAKDTTTNKSAKKVPTAPSTSSSVLSFLSRSTGFGKFQTATASRSLTQPATLPSSKPTDEKKRPSSSSGSFNSGTNGGASAELSDSDTGVDSEMGDSDLKPLPMTVSSAPPPRGLIPSRSLSKTGSSRRLLSGMSKKLPLSARASCDVDFENPPAVTPVACGVVVVFDTQLQSFAPSWEKRLAESQLGPMQSVSDVLKTIEDLLSLATSKFDMTYERQSILGDISTAILQSKRSLIEMDGGNNTRVSTTDQFSFPLTPDKTVDPLQEIPFTMAATGITIESLASWDFNALPLQKALLHQIPFLVFQESGLLTHFNISTDRFKVFVDSFEPLYHDNPFHNLWHANTVGHMCFMFLRETKASSVLDPLYKLAFLLSAYCHDLDHPGNTNAFEMNSSSELAVRYNDQSVLENHHCSMAFKILRNPACDMMSGFSTDSYKIFRKTMVTSILGTDMALHFQLYDQLKSKIDASDTEWQITSAQDSQFLVKVLLHAADLSNPVRSFDMTKSWATRIATEFNLQIKKERASNLPVLGFMETKSEQEQAKNELNFVSLFVEPMWKTLSEFLPEVGCLVQNMETNMSTWKELSTQTTITPLPVVKGFS